MVDEPTNLVLEHLKAIRAEMAQMSLRLGEISGTQSGMLKIMASHDESLRRIEQRVELIEKRLGLIEA